MYGGVCVFIVLLTEHAILITGAIMATVTVAPAVTTIDVQQFQTKAALYRVYLSTAIVINHNLPSILIELANEYRIYFPGDELPLHLQIGSYNDITPLSFIFFKPYLTRAFFICKCVFCEHISKKFHNCTCYICVDVRTQSENCKCSFCLTVVLWRMLYASM